MSNLRLVIRVFLLILLVSFGVLTARAQFSSSVEGTVTDASGAVVPRATVTLQNVQTGVSQTMPTSSAGSYRFNALPPGQYTVTVTATGFATIVQENIAVQVTEVRTVNVALQVGTTATHVTVSTAPAAVQLDEASITGVIGARTLSDLPLANRNFVDVFGLTPGVTGVPQANADIFFPGIQVNLNAGGQRTDSNNFLVNGASVTSPEGGPSGQLMVMPNIDSIQDVRVQVNNFSAEYGRNAGAQVSVVTKQGANRFHGTLSEYHEDNALTSRTEFESSIPVYRRNDMAWTFGGPIQKDKTFFFATMDILRAGNASASPVLLPTPTFINWMQQNNPNKLSTGLFTKYTPAVQPTGNYTTAGTIAGVDCSTLASPGTPITSVAGSIPCNLPVFGETNFAASTPEAGLQWGVRVDHNFGSKDRLYGNIMRTHQSENFANVYPAFNQPYQVGSWFANLHETHTFSPNVLNELSLSYLRGAGLLGVDQPQVPFIYIFDMGTFNYEIGPFTYAENQPQISDTLSWMHGRHNLRFGGTYSRDQGLSDWSGQGYRPVFFFFNPLDFAADAPFEEANVNFNPVTGAKTGLVTSFRVNNVGFFVQDDFKIKPNLTLNFGLRWEDYGNPSAKDKLITNFVFQGGNSFQERIANAKVDRVPHLWNHAVVTNFAPRLGFAWDPTKKGKISIRGGAGIFYDRPINNIFGETANNPPLLADATFATFLPGPQPLFSVGTTTARPYGYTDPSPLPVGLDSKNGIPGANVSVFGTDPNYGTARTGNIFFGVQYAFSTNWTVEADYLGSFGRHLYDHPNVNRYDGSIIQNNGVLVRPNTSFGQMSYGQANGTSAFSGGTFAVTKRYSHGLSALASYTFGKTTDSNSVFIGPGNNPTNQIDISNPKHDRGLADFNIAKKFAMTGIWDLPGPHSGSKFASKVLGGWEVSSVLTLQSGSPFTVVCTTPFEPVRDVSGAIIGNAGCDYNADGTAYDTPDQPSFGNSLHNLKRSNYLTGIFKKSDFPAPPLGQEGNLGRNTFFGPGFADTDLGIIKNTQVPWFLGNEGAKLQLRAELLNAFNRVNLSGVNSDLGGTFFGQSTAQFPARTIQLGIRLAF